MEPRKRTTTKNKANDPVLGQALSADHLESLLMLSSDWYWEQDEHYRFTRIKGHALEKAGFNPQDFLGLARWDHCGRPVGDDGNWDKHMATLQAHKPFSDFLFKSADSQGNLHYINSSGEPVFDEQGEFRGYRGLSKDVTRRFQAELRLTMEHGVTRILAESNSITEAAPQIIRLICESLDWACGARWDFDDQNNSACSIETWGVAAPGIKEFLNATTELDLPKNLGGLVRQTRAKGEPVWISDVTQEESFVREPYAVEAGLRSAFAFPIKVGAQVIGVMEFFSREIHQPDTELLNATRYIGSQIGQFLQNQRAGEALRQSEARFRSLTSLSSDWFWEQDAEFRFTRFEGRHITGDNSAFKEELGKTREELGVAVEGGADTHCAVIQSHLPYRDVIMWRTFQDGKLHYMSVSGEPMFDKKGQFIGYRGVGADVTQRKCDEQVTRRLGRMFAALSATNDAILHAKSPEELYQRVCDASVLGGKFSNTTLLLAEEGDSRVKAMASAGRVPQQLRASHISIDGSIPEGRGLVGIAFRSQRPCVSNDFLHDERTIPWHEIGREAGCLAAAAFPLTQGRESVGAILIHYDELNAFDDEIVKLLERMAENVSFALDKFENEAEHRRAQERIQYLATHDTLTDLPNRMMFNQVLNHTIESAARYNQLFAVFFIDLDRFKIINDTLGHVGGDLLLQEMSKRIKQNLRASDFIARLGGDEFVMLLQGISKPEEVSTVARKLLSSIFKPVVIQEQECRVTASIGISMYPKDAQNEQELMKCADLAMYLAKEEGKNNYQFYSKEINALSLERLTLETSLRRALDQNEFFLEYQPKVDLATDTITGVEALIRWKHPNLGLVSPLQFIPLAEETGLIVPIGKWVLMTACAQNVTWQRAGLSPVCMAVNLSPRQFAHQDLLKDLAEVLKETGMDPGLLELEITESMVMGNVDRAAHQLTTMKEMGVRLAIDDFGTGYSSLAQIKRFPIDTIKVDRSFIREIPHDIEDKAITEAIIAMGKSLNLSVVAEGVETQEQKTFLRDLSCNEMQGYHFSKPVDSDKLAELLHTHGNETKKAE